MARLSAYEYEHMLDLAADILRNRDPEPPWHLVMAELCRALHTTATVLTRATWERREGRAEAWSTGVADGGRMSVISARMVEAGHPFARHYCTEQDSVPRTAGDIMGRSAWQHSSARSLTRELLGAQHVLALPLPAPPGSARGFIIYHATEDFSLTERTYAGRIQPLLAGIDAHYRHLAAWRARFPAPMAPGGATPEQCAAEQRLTPRELTVLTLLADSLPANAIGRRLGISTRTVHKHVQNLYRKLDVTDRLSAVLRAQSTGLLPGARRE